MELLHIWGHWWLPYVGLTIDSTSLLTARIIQCAGLRIRLALSLSILCLAWRIERPVERRHVGILLWCPLRTTIVETAELPL